MKHKNLLIAALLLTIGALMLFFPSQCVRAVVILLGLVAVINGIYNLWHTRKLIPDTAFQNAVTLRAALGIVVGLVAFFLPLLCARALWAVTMYALAVYLLLSAVGGLFIIGKLHGADIDRKQFLLDAIISFVASAAMFIIPAKIGVTLVRVGGAMLLAVGALYVFYIWKNRSPEPVKAEVIDDI